MNTCPVYRRSGGHSYGTTVPGPIGSILAPARNAEQYKSLPFACSLCGSCTDVCPVKIDLHHQLLHWRAEIAKSGLLSWNKRLQMKLAAFVMNRPWLYRQVGRVIRIGLRFAPGFIKYNRFNQWGIDRDLPEPPSKSFRQLYQLRADKKDQETHEQS